MSHSAEVTTGNVSYTQYILILNSESALLSVGLCVLIDSLRAIKISENVLLV